MLAEALRTFYDYNTWATERIFDTAAQLTPEQLEAPGEAGRGSIRNTLLHLITTHKGWLSWWDGSLTAEEAIRFPLDLGDNPDLAAIRAAWDEVAEQTSAFIGSLGDEDAERPYTFAPPVGPTWKNPLWQMMLHVANHGTQHRSEIATMLTAAGHSPGDLDLLFYCFDLAQHGGE